MSQSTRICLLGFGEVGQTLAADLLAADTSQLTAYDVLFSQPASGPSRAAATAGVRVASDAHEAVAGADLIISAVTAAQDLAAAGSVVGALQRATYFLDVNSVSPGVKTQAAALIEQAGGRYVEAAIMSPIAPQRIASPMLLGGQHAAGFVALAAQLGFAGAEVFSHELGRASAAKMCRSVIVKGMESLLAESLLAARHYGVESTVLDSLKGLFPTASWSTLARYMISRSLIHGRRRAEEMREVARTVAEAGLEPHMSLASAQRQNWAAGFPEAASVDELETMLDAILGRVDAQRTPC